LIPTILGRLEAAREAKVRIEQKIDEWRKRRKTMTAAEEAVLKGQVDYMATQLENVLGDITALGCMPKDLDAGLVDFPTRIDGKEGYLCWKVGESNITYWHNLTDGFSGRKKLNLQEKIS